MRRVRAVLYLKKENVHLSKMLSCLVAATVCLKEDLFGCTRSGLLSQTTARLGLHTYGNVEVGRTREGLCFIIFIILPAVIGPPSPER